MSYTYELEKREVELNVLKKNKKLLRVATISAALALLAILGITFSRIHMSQVVSEFITLARVGTFALVIIFMYSIRTNFRYDRAEEKVKSLKAERNRDKYGATNYYEVCKFKESYLVSPSKREARKSKGKLWISENTLHFTKDFATMLGHVSLNLDELASVDCIDFNDESEPDSRAGREMSKNKWFAGLRNLHFSSDNDGYVKCFTIITTNNGEPHYFETVAIDIIRKESDFFHR